jgi:hypothetical protein
MSGPAGIARAPATAPWQPNVAGYQHTQFGRVAQRGNRGVVAHLQGEREPAIVTTGDVQNISARGARVHTSEPWKPRERLEIRVRGADFRVRAEVVYCQTLGAAEYAVGLHFMPVEPEIPGAG